MIECAYVRVSVRASVIECAYIIVRYACYHSSDRKETQSKMYTFRDIIAVHQLKSFIMCRCVECEDVYKDVSLP